MAWEFTPYSLPPLVAALVGAVLVFEAWLHRDRAVARPFLALSVALTAWSAAYAVQIGFTDLASQVLWWRIGITAGGTIPTFWLLLVDPFAFTLSVWTNPGGLIWRAARFGDDPSVVEFAFGPGYLVHIGYAYLLVVSGILLIVGVYLRSSRIYRRQAGLLVVGAVVPLGANVAFTLGVSPVSGLDLTTSAFTLTGAVFALALFRFEFLDLAPVARQNMIDELGDGFLVVDEDGVVREHNENAERILEASLAVGEPVDGALPGGTVEEADGAVVRPESSDGRRAYQVHAETLRDYQGDLAGRVIALRDVTDRERYEQRLEVANRLLRHNLRNDMNVVIGRAERLAEELSGERAESARRIARIAGDVADMSRKADRIEATLEAERSEPVVVDAVGIVEAVAARFRGTDGAAVEVEAPESAPVEGVREDLLAAAVTNLVENAIEHHDRPGPRVRVRVRAGEGRVRIGVADDGPGIPEVEHRVLSAGRETALEHGSGIGLWLVHWIVSASGGELSFEPNEPRGSVVTMALPAPEVTAR